VNVELVAQKLASMGKKIEADKGLLELLGLFLRDESPDRWDIVIAGPGLKADRRASFEYVAGQLRKVMTDEELTGLSRIVILDHGGAVLQSFLEQFSNRSGLADVHFVAEGGAVIRKAYIILARPGVARRRRPKKPHPGKAAS
jgi:hypothetical protein